jgi:hypothetical protein
VNVAGIPDMLAQDLDEPQLRMISHMAEVELREVLLFFLDVAADIARETENLREDGMHLHANVAPTKDFLACFEGPAVRRDQHNVNVLCLEFLTSSSALGLTLLSDAAVDILLGVRHLPVEVRKLDTVLPAHVWVQDLLKAQKALIEVRLCMADRNEVTVLLFSWYLFKHTFYC